MKPYMTAGNIISQCQQKMKVLKKKPYWGPFVKSVKFSVHFMVVMVILYCGACVFARLEDPDIMYRNDNISDTNTTTEPPILKSGRTAAGGKAIINILFSIKIYST